MKIYLFILSLTCIGFSSDSITINQSTLQFTGSHPFHDWTGVSTKMETEISCNQNNTICDINFSIPWMSFDSGNDNRDNNMLYYVNAFDYPSISMKFKQINLSKLMESEKSLSAILNMNGSSNSISIPVNYQLSKTQLKVSSSFHISLEDYNIERPSLLLIPIEDLIYIHVDINGNLR